MAPTVAEAVCARIQNMANASRDSVQRGTIFRIRVNLLRRRAEHHASPSRMRSACRLFFFIPWLGCFRYGMGWRFLGDEEVPRHPLTNPAAALAGVNELTTSARE